MDKYYFKVLGYECCQALGGEGLEDINTLLAKLPGILPDANPPMTMGSSAPIMHAGCGYL
jgi:hypothetical protein